MYNLVVVQYFYKSVQNGDRLRVTVEKDGEILHEFGEDGYEKAMAYVSAFYDLFGTHEVSVTDEDRIEE
jgi:hypothetical protein